MDEDSYINDFGQGGEQKHAQDALATVEEEKVQIEEEEEGEESDESEESLQNAQGDDLSSDEEEEEEQEEQQGAQQHEPPLQERSVLPSFSAPLASTNCSSLPKESAADARERARLCARLRRLAPIQGFALNDSAPLAVLKHQNWLATQQGRMELSVKMVRRVTLLIARACEYLANLLPDTFVNLNGYTEALTLQLDDYGELIRSLCEYYGDVITAQSPLLTYLGAIGSSMMMYSISSSFMRVKAPRAKRTKSVDRDDLTAYETVAPAAAPAPPAAASATAKRKREDDDDEIMSASSSNSKQIKISL